MERVKIGELYFFIKANDYLDFTTGYEVDVRNKQNDDDFEKGNYFLTNDDAVSAIMKLRAVLKGADVIEMPSEEEMQTLETKDIVMAEFLEESYKDSDVIMHGRHAYWKGWNAATRWIKSKIIK